MPYFRYWKRRKISATMHCLQTLKAFAGEIEKKVGYVMWPIRTAISGKQNTPGGATEIMDVLGKEESIARIKKAIEKLETR